MTTEQTIMVYNVGEDVTAERLSELKEIIAQKKQVAIWTSCERNDDGAIIEIFSTSAYLMSAAELLSAAGYKHYGIRPYCSGNKTTTYADTWDLP